MRMLMITARIYYIYNTRTPNMLTIQNYLDLLMIFFFCI